MNRISLSRHQKIGVLKSKDWFHFIQLSDNHSFTLIKENFENSHSEKLQIRSVLLLSDNHSFIMAEENFEI